jgi:hypothetical protein
VLEFWTHDERQATAALSRGFTVSGVDPDGLAGSADPSVG